MPDIFNKDKEEHKPAAQHHTQAAPHPDAHAIQSVKNLLHAKENPIDFFSSFVIRPQGVSFVNQEPDEVPLLFIRRHFITNIPWIATTIGLFLLPLLIGGLALLPGVIPENLPAGIIIAVTIFYYLVVMTYAFSNFLSWFYNIGIITQKRVVDLDATNIFSHNSATAIFNEIVDVKVTQKGFLQSSFHFGDVHIQTEAIHANFEFHASPQPDKVSDLISDLRVATKGGHEQKHG